MKLDQKTVIRRLRYLRHPIALIRRIRHNISQQRSVDRQIRTSVENRSSAPAQTPPRRRMKFPSHAEDVRKADFFNMWWYYDAELLPGVTTKGIYPPDLPLLPRAMLRDCELTGTACLEVGPMEGIIPVLMSRRGASRVLAIDAIDGCAEKMEALKHYYGVEFDFQVVGLMYDLYKKLNGEAFDVINCSGLLYHVFSPLHVLSGLRPLLKRNGLLIVSTGIIKDPGYSMEFNNAGRIQEESNTFWYVSVPLLDYMLRYLALAPIDCRFLWHSSLEQSHARLRFDKPSGYISVVCRAVDDVLPAEGDAWMRRSAQHSWEHRGLCDWALAGRQPFSSVAYRREVDPALFRSETDSLDLWKAVHNLPENAKAERVDDSHALRLADYS